MNRRHRRGDDPRCLLRIQQRFHHMGQCRSGATRRGNDVMLHRIVYEVIDAIDQHHAVFRHFLRGIGKFERSAGYDFLSARFQVAPQAPLGMVRRKSGVEKLPGAIYDNAHTVLCPIYISRIPGFFQHLYRNAFHLNDAFGLVQNLYIAAFSGKTVKESIQCSISGIRGKVLHDIVDSLSDFSAGIDDDAVIMLHVDMIPKS